MNQLFNIEKAYVSSLIIIVLIILLVTLNQSCNEDETESFVKIETGEVSKITSNSATVAGIIEDPVESEITHHGHCWDAVINPDTYLDTKTDLGTRDSAGTYYSELTGLSSNTKYYVRAYATNSAGTAYGREDTFTTKNPSVKDFDGNVYKTAKICNQVWMAENLATTHYADGTPLVDGTGAGSIAGDYTTKYWFVYDDDPANKATYGLLYTWAAAMNGSASSSANPSGVQGVCPSGWHIPSEAEWIQLEICLGMPDEQLDLVDWRGTNEGGKLKEKGTNHWNNPNAGATNESGFTALPGGHSSDAFNSMGEYADFWSSTEKIENAAWSRHLRYDGADIYRNGSYNNLVFSVRCVKD